ncbi:MAG TPA: TIGR03086 family metal-binding protein [Acidimicrobiales bacterium]
MSTSQRIVEPDEGPSGAEQLGRVVPTLAAYVAKVAPSDLRLSTPCAGWTTRDLLNHVVGGAEMFAGALRGGPLHAISGRQPDVVGSDPFGAFERAATTFGQAAEQPGSMERILNLPVGTMTGQTFLRYAAFDLLVHTWDLATTLGDDLEVPDEVVEPCERFARQVLAELPRDGVDFAAAVEPPPAADAMARLAYTGRTA